MRAALPVNAVLALMSAFSTLLTLSTPAAAEDEKNPPPIETPPPIEPREDEKSPPEVPAPTPGAPETLEPEAPAKPKAPVPDVSTGGLGAGPCWGSTIGCGALGCLPGAGTAIGAGVFVTSISAALAQSSGAIGTCLGALGVAGGVFIGAPSAIVLGPCASGGALAGGLVGAALDDRDLSPVFLGALPGLGAGLLASGGAVWGLAVLSSSSGDFQTPALILGSAAALALLAGPITIAGISIADGAAGDKARDAIPASTHAKPGDEPDIDVVLRVPPRGRMAF